MNGTKPVLIIEDDTQFADVLKNYLEDYPHLGPITVAQNGDEGWRKLLEKRFSLVILDWKLPKLSGLIIFNRLRTTPGMDTIPVLITSGLLDEADLNLLGENLVTKGLEKPFTQDVFDSRLTDLMAESEWLDQNQTRIHQILAKVEKSSPNAVADLQNLLKESANPVPLALLAAKVLRTSDRLAEAEALLKFVLTRDPNNSAGLFELGRILYQAKRTKEAHAILQKAQKLSPKNLDRAKLMGEVGLNSMDPKAAESGFKAALALDAQDAKAKLGLETATAMISTPPKTPEPTAEGGFVFKSFASVMNLAAVSLVEQGQYEQAVKKYQETLEFLSDPWDRSRILYNLGLAYVRWQKPEEAKTWLESAVRLSGGKLGKASSLLDRSTGGDSAAILAAEDLELKLSDDHHPSSRSSDDSDTSSRLESSVEESKAGRIEVKPAIESAPAQVALQKPPVPVPTLISSSEVFDTVRSAQSQFLKERSSMAKSEEPIGQLRILVFHPITGGSVRLSREIKKLGCIALDQASTSAEVLDALHNKQSDLLIAWYQEDTKVSVSEVLEECYEDDSLHRFGVLMHFTGETSMSRFSSKSYGFPIDSTRSIQWTRARISDDIRATQTAAANPTSTFSILNKIRSALSTIQTNPASAASISGLLEKIVAGMPDRNKNRWFRQAQYRLLAASGQTTESIEAIDRLTKENPMFISAVIDAAVYRAKAGNFEALKKLPARLKIQNQISPSRYLHIACHMAQHGLKEEIHSLLLDWEVDTKSSLNQNYYTVASKHYIDNPNASLACLSQGVKIAPLDIPTLLEYSNQLGTMEDFTAAATAANFATAILPFDERATLASARWNALSESWEPAEHQLRLFLSKVPGNMDAKAALESVLKRDKKWCRINHSNV